MDVGVRPGDLRDRQQDIHGKLALLGPGPQDFYLDACQIMNGNASLRTATHLVGHLMREIESALREVLRTVLELPPSPSKNSHDAEIEMILEEIDPDKAERMEEAWKSLNLHEHAHRRDLRAPRRVNAEFEEIWQEWQVILELTLDALEARFATALDMVDDFREIDDPSENDARALRRDLPNNRVTNEHFFQELDDPAWLIPLISADFFSEPPPPHHSASGDGVVHPPWPPLQYLICMASEEPERVSEVIREMPPTPNIQVLSSLIECLRELPPDISAEHAEAICEDIATLGRHYQYHRRIGKDLAGWGKELLEAGEVDAGQRILRFVLADNGNSSDEDGLETGGDNP